MPTTRCDVVIVGGGIVGLATARAVADTGKKVVVVEAEQRIATHQTARNSGVIHSGLYYTPGSTKAASCRQGADALYAYCDERGIRHERCGKLVVAGTDDEVAALDELERRGKANGLQDMKRLEVEELREREPHVAGVAGLWVPQTGIVDFVQVAHAYADDVRARGGEIRTDESFVNATRSDGGTVVTTTSGEISAAVFVNCGGLHADRIATRCGVDPLVRIVPFRGEYYELLPHRRSLVKNLIYPVPDPKLPFLGVHLTRHVDGSVSAGPNAVLALKRDGYGRFSFSLRDFVGTVAYPGFWRLSRRYWRTGASEWMRSVSKRAFVAAMRRLVPEICAADVRRAGCGIRAQALERDGTLVHDFRIAASDGQIHVLNAPSPAATASLSIGATIARMAVRQRSL
ncbi:MAG: L-2-hydroxyglutarate oxidase [Planctomycetes bacterium]|nr:L-2-hydroxyglutarate oxidase [Planctomycetota bacterium]